MQSLDEKKSLIQEMISFALVDGDLHDKEYDFIKMIAADLNIDKATFLLLFNERQKYVVAKDEFSRISHFYRLALLMYCDGKTHEKEKERIREIGLKMALNPIAVEKVLERMQETDNHMIDGATLLSYFQENYN